MDETQNPLPLLVIPVGTKVVLRFESQATAMSPLRSKGEVAVIVAAPDDGRHSYRVRFADGEEMNVRCDELSILKHLQKGPLCVSADVLSDYNLSDYVIYRCVVGSQAYGLSRESSDVDRRGIYLPPAELEWSIYGVPEQLENADREECYWELKKFISLALKANPNILECLYSPLVEQSSVVADALLAKRSIFLSKLIYQTYNGYAMSQFKKLEQDLRATGT